MLRKFGAEKGEGLLQLPLWAGSSICRPAARDGSLPGCLSVLTPPPLAMQPQILQANASFFGGRYAVLQFRARGICGTVHCGMPNRSPLKTLQVLQVLCAVRWENILRGVRGGGACLKSVCLQLLKRPGSAGRLQAHLGAQCSRRRVRSNITNRDQQTQRSSLLICRLVTCRFFRQTGCFCYHILGRTSRLPQTSH